MPAYMYHLCCEHLSKAGIMLESQAGKVVVYYLIFSSFDVFKKRPSGVNGAGFYVQKP